VVIVVAIHEISSVASPRRFCSGPKAGVFVKGMMNALADLGEKMGADPGLLDIVEFDGFIWESD
jgi:hypothetical protein